MQIIEISQGMEVERGAGARMEACGPPECYLHREDESAKKTEGNNLRSGRRTTRDSCKCRHDKE